MGNDTPPDISNLSRELEGPDAGLGFSGSAKGSPGEDWEPQGLDVRTAPAAMSCPGVMTSEPPVTVLPVGIFPADVIDVVFEHPGVEVSTLVEMLLARSKASISGYHRRSAKELLNVAVLSS